MMGMITRLSNHGGVMMGMITRVEKMVVQSSVKPIIEKLDRTNMKQRNNNDAISSPQRYEMSFFQQQVSNIVYQSIKYDLIIPVSFSVNLIKFDAFINNSIITLGSPVTR